jgi:hypothetical protein
MCVCSLRYTACSAHAPYYIVICSLSGSTVFYVISKTALFSKKKSYWTQNMCFGVPPRLFSATFLILRRIHRDIINVHRTSYKVPAILLIYQWNLKFLDKVFKKYSDIKFCENRFSGSRAVPCGRMDGQMGRHDEANSRFSQFCESVSKLMAVHGSGPEQQCTYYGVRCMLSSFSYQVAVKNYERENDS